MNRTAFFFITLFILPALVSCAEKKDSVLRLGYLHGDLHHLPAFVALEKGFYSEQGLNIQVSGAFRAGPEEMSAFGAEELDIGYVGQAPATAAVLNGVADIQFIAQVNLEGSAIITRSDAVIKSVRELAGKTVAIPGHATMQDFLLRRALRNAGLKFQDISAIVLKPPEMLQALQQHTIDAFIAWQPYPAQAVSVRSGNVLLDSTGIWKNHPCCVLVAQRSVCAGNPGLIKKIQAAHARACSFIESNHTEAVAIGMKYTAMDRPVLEEALRGITFTSSLDRSKSREFVDFLKQQHYVNSDDTDERFLNIFFER